MLSLSTLELLDLWETGLARSPTEWALLLLARAFPDMQMESLAGLCIGRRDALLLSLRDQIFGPNLACVTACRSCGEQMELDFCSRDIMMLDGLDDTDLSGPFSLTMDGFEVKYRLPNSLDLLAIGGNKEVSFARHILIERCLLNACKEGQEVRADQLPPVIGNAISECMSQLDPQADLRLEMNCPSCGRSWLEIFDIVSFFWKEISAWAQRIFRDVGTLAGFYGWSEKDILAMSGYRRQIYLDMVDQ
jgi:hypothetical protein